MGEKRGDTNQRRTIWTGFWNRAWRPALAALVGLVGLGVVTLGPAAVALGWQERNQHQAETQTARYHLGTQVHDGSVTFVLHEVRCGESDDSTHGRLCELTLAARNDGDTEVAVPGGMQLLRAAEGARHQPVTDDGAQFGTLAPGASATAVLVFDLPPQTTVTHLEVHGDVYSRGRPIDLGGPPLPLAD